MYSSSALFIKSTGERCGDLDAVDAVVGGGAVEQRLVAGGRVDAVDVDGDAVVVAGPGRLVEQLVGADCR